MILQSPLMGYAYWDWKVPGIFIDSQASWWQCRTISSSSSVALLLPMVDCSDRLFARELHRSKVQRADVLRQCVHNKTYLANACRLESATCASPRRDASKMTIASFTDVWQVTHGC